MESSQPVHGEETSHGLQDAPSRAVSPAWMAAGIIALLVFGLLAYALFARSTVSLEVGGPVPNFQLTALDGSTMDLASQRGNVVVVNFFSSWCNPCRQEAAELEHAWRDHKDRGVQFYGIAYKDAESKAQFFLTEFEVTYPSAVETGNRTARAYGVTGVPETFVVDQQGKLVQHFIGAITATGLGQVLDPLLDQ